MMRKQPKVQWRVLDSWALVKGDAEGGAVENCVARMLENFPGASVRTFRRAIRAGGAYVPCVVIVARARVKETAHATP